MLATEHPHRHPNPCNNRTGRKHNATLEPRPLPRERVRSMTLIGY